MADKQNEQTEHAAPDLQSVVSALFAASGAVAPVDFALFGRRVGEIIARAGGPRRRSNDTGHRR